MDYKEIINIIYIHLIDKPWFDLCGPDSQKAMEKLEILEQQANLDRHSCSDMEMLVNAGFAENAENGFYYGFQSAVALLTGSKFEL